jgi:hypothetical protein
MAERPATPSTIASVVSAAQAGDVILMGLGTYPSLPRKSGLTYRAFDHGEPGRAVKDTRGHLGQGFQVRVTDFLGGSYSGVTYEGIFWDTRERRGINGAVLSGRDVGFLGCVAVDRPTDGSRRIMLTPLGPSTSQPFEGFVWSEGRVHLQGKWKDTHDHPFYLKHCLRPRITDSLIYDAGWFPLHLYPNCDEGDFSGLVIWGCGSAAAFSAENASANPSAGLTGASERNRLARSIIGAGHGRPGGQSGGGGYLIESYAPSGAPRPVGNVVEWCFLTRFGGTAQLVQPGIGDRVALVDCVTGDADPGFTDPAGGDFRLRPGSPALGYGPAWIQPQGAPPPPPPPDPEPEPPPPPPLPNPHRISPELRSALSERVLHRMAQQQGRALALAARFEERREAGYAERAREVAVNTDLLVAEVAELLDGAEEA